MTQPSKRRPPQPKNPQPQQPAAAPVDDLTLAADVLFGTPDSPLILRDGRAIVVEKGKVRHIGLLLSFFTALTERVSKEDIIALVSFIEERRAKADGTYSTPGVDELVASVFGRGHLLVTMFQSLNDVLGKVVASMTPITEEQFQDLDMDEGVALVVAVVGVNYRFFSQNLPGAVRAFLVAAVKKTASK